MQNVQINSDPEKTSSNVCEHEVNNNNIDENYKCNSSSEISEETLKNTLEENNDSKEENQNSTKYVPVRYSYSGGYFDKQFAEIEVQMNLAEVKNSLAKTCEILREINFLESLRKGSKLSEAKLESSQEFEITEVSEISKTEHTS